MNVLYLHDKGRGETEKAGMMVSLLHRCGRRTATMSYGPLFQPQHDGTGDFSVSTYIGTA